MKNLKKVLALVVVFAMMLSTVAFAAVPSEVSEGIEDENVKAAVEKLVAFGIVAGKEDGKYHPEQGLTRAEFAKLAVEALGLGAAAQAATTTQFTDVPAGHWATGYISVAAGQGLIQGRGDGTFGPELGVTYPEAVTILVRALGYKDSFLPGVWPSNYVAKAAELDVTDNVKYAAGGTVDRGSAAVLLSNTLDANIITQSSYGDENNWSEDLNTTLLESKLSIEEVEELIVTATPKVSSSIDENQITLSNGETGSDAWSETYDVVSDFIDLDSLLGLSLDIYLDDDEIVYVEESDKNFKVFYDVLDEEEDIDSNSITFVNVDNDYDWADAAEIYLDNEDVTVAQLAAAATTGSEVIFGKVVLDNSGSVVLLDLQEFDSENAVIVTAIDEDKGTITYNVDDADDENVAKVGDDDYFDKYVITDAAGNIMDLADIEKDDIIYINTEDRDGDDLEEAASGDEVAYVVVVRNAVEGIIDTYDDEEIEIDDEAYDWSDHGQATVSVDNDDEYVYAGDNVSELDDASDEEAEIIALLDLEGNVRHIRTDIESSSDDFYGIVTGAERNYGDYSIMVVNYEEDEVEYNLDLDDLVGYTSEANIAANDIIKYTVNSDGDIDTLEFIGSYDGATDTVETFRVGATANSDAIYDTFDDDFEDETVEFNSDSFIVDDDVVVFDYTAAGTLADFDPADAEVLDYANLVDKDGLGAEAFVLFGDNDVVKLIVFTGNFQGTDDEEAGYIVDRRTKDGDAVIDIVLPGVDGTTRYTVDDGSSLAADEDVVVFKMASDGKVDLVAAGNGGTANDYDTVTGVVYEIDGKYVTIVDHTGAVIGTYKVASNAVFYMEDDEKSFSDLDEEVSLVRVAVKDKIIEVAKIYDVTKGTSETDGEADAFYDAYLTDSGNTITSVDQLYNDGTVADEYDPQ